MASFWILFLCAMSVSVVRTGLCDEEDDTLTEEEFVPTSEWQEVKPGQSIPPGLHVRLDLQNGGKWAKLMDESKDTDIRSIVVKDSPAPEGPKKDGAKKAEGMQDYKVEELKAALKKMKNERAEEPNEHEKQKIKDKFRSMDEIRSAFEELNLNQESDFNVMTRLLKKFRDPETPHENKLLALQDLENYVHQVDNAVDFTKVDGMITMVQALNSTQSDIRLEAAHVIGSAVQSNPAVQVKAMEAGALPSLIRIIVDEKQHSETRKKALYAVSCLIRHFPAAQFFFKNAGGFAALSSCFSKHGTEKLQLKALSLINDLAVERKDLFASDNDDHADERIRQYKLFSLSTVIEEMGLCNDMVKMLSSGQHDMRDMLLTVMKNLHGVCKQTKDYILHLKNSLGEYKTQYRNLMLEEEKEGDTDSFFHHMYDSVSDLTKLVNSNNEGITHIEL